MDQDSAHMMAASKVPMLKLGSEKIRSTLMMGIPNEHQLKFNFIKDAKLLLEAVEKRFGGNAATKKTQRNLLKQLQKLLSQLELLDEKLSQEDVNQKLLRSLSPAWNTHAIMWRNKAELETMSMDDLYNNLKVFEPEGKGMSSSSSNTQIMTFVSSSNNNTSSSNEAVNAAHGDTPASIQVNKNTGKKLTINGNETIGFDKSKVEYYNCYKRGHFARECRAPRNQDNKNEESSKRIVPVETSTSTTLVSCDGLGGYDWSDQAEEEPNYALMAYSFLSSNSEIVDNCKKGLGYEKYNAVPPPYTGNFMSLTPDLSFTGLDEFVNKLVGSKLREKDLESQKWTIILGRRVNHQKFAKKNLVPRAVLMKSGLVLVNTARQVNTTHSKTTVNAARPMSYLSKIAHSTVKRPIHKNTSFKNSNIDQRVNIVSGKKFNIARPKAVVNVVKGNSFNVVKASACWVWKPKHKVLDHVSKHNSASITLKKFDYIDAQGRSKSVMAWVPK
ncbi:ribonuclease H-like domain-containing protein [Tanacetum coccineum]